MKWHDDGGDNGGSGHKAIIDIQRPWRGNMATASAMPILYDE